MINTGWHTIPRVLRTLGWKTEACWASKAGSVACCMALVPEIGEGFDGWVTASFDQSAPQEETITGIQTEQLNGGGAFIRQRHNAGTGEKEVITPAVLAWMIQTHETRRSSDEGSGVGAFGDIAAQAGECEVGGGGGALMLSADDVIDLEGEGGIRLMNQAVFAEAMSTLNDETASVMPP